MSLTLYGAPLSPFVRKVACSWPKRASTTSWKRSPCSASRPGIARSARWAASRRCATATWPRRLQRDLPVPGRTHPEPPNLQGDAARAAVRWLEKYADYEIAPLATLTIFRNRILAGDGPGLRGERRASRAGGKAASALRLPENHLDGRALRRRAADLADLAIASQLVNLRHAGENLDEQRWPALAAHFARMLERPMQALLPGNDGPSTSSQRKPERVAQQSVRRRNISTRPSIPVLGAEARHARAVQIEHSDQAAVLSRGTTSSLLEALSQAMWPETRGRRRPAGSAGHARRRRRPGEGNADAGDLALNGPRTSSSLRFR